jgi:short-subunit dehydrogenase
MKLVEKTVMITGASSGLGRAIALELSRRENNIIATARREHLLITLKEKIEAQGSQCISIAADATDREQVREVINAGVEAFKKIDVAILNAGGGTGVSMANTSPEVLIKQMRKNYDTLVKFLCPLIDHMKKSGGTIAYTSSPAGYFGLPKSGPYGAAKSAGRYLFDTCRIELANSPIKFVTLLPGFTYTEGFKSDDVPFKALIIKKERAVREMIYAIEHDKTNYIFPKRIKLLIAIGQILPEPIRRKILLTFSKG